MSGQDNDAVSFSQGRLHAFKVVNLNVLRQIFFVKVRHVEYVEHVARQVHEGRPHKFSSLSFGNVQSRHHLRNRPFPLLFDKQIIQISQHLPRE